MFLKINLVVTTWITWDSFSALFEERETLKQPFYCSNKVHLWKSDTPVLMTNIFLPFSQTSELGVTEHVEGDPCKFALWVGRTPTSDNKIVLKVKDTSHLHLKPPWGFDRYWFSKAEASDHWGINILKLNIAGLKIPYSCVGFHHQGWPNVLENLNIGLTQFSLYQPCPTFRPIRSSLCHLVWLHEQLQGGPRSFLYSPSPLLSPLVYFSVFCLSLSGSLCLLLCSIC